MNLRRESPGASLLSLSFHRLKRHPRPPDSNLPRPSIFKPGRNVWRTEHARRVSFLIDADAFFRAFAEAAARAEKQILILGWDTDSRTEVPRPEGFDLEGLSKEERLRLGDFLIELLRQKPDLRVYVLSWDFAFIYLFEREILPGVKFSTLGADRVRFVLDREHPFGASHHQKVVVIDDAVAFSGGLDITQRRWDTPEHLGGDERRRDPGGQLYGPFHDVQICVDNDAARALGDLARERWWLATSEQLEAPTSVSHDPWPESARVDFKNTSVAIARTLPLGYRHDAEARGSRPVLEVERLFLDAIRFAERFIYIENQYFTSPQVAKALARRLSEEKAPEIILVLPRDQTGWIEESTMGLLRSEALRLIEAADHKKRFRCYHPIVPDLGHGYVKVHSKVMIVDDVFVRIGSANLNNRSMGLDTECDLAIEAGARDDIRDGIARLRRTLLGEHLGVEPDEFEARFLIKGSLLQTVESFRGRERSLVEIRPETPLWVSHFLPPGEWIDPHAPRGIRRWLTKRLTLNREALALLLITGVSLGLLILSALEEQGELPTHLKSLASAGHLLTRFVSWLRSLDAEKLALHIESFRHQIWAIPAILVGFVLGSLFFVPITAMILGVALTYPPAEALTLIMGGTMLAALAMYGVGRYWAWSKSRFLARPWIQELSRQLNTGGLLTVALVRLMPIAPFAAVSIVAGGLRISVRNYMLGSFLGLLPGCLIFTFVSREVLDSFSEGRWFKSVLVLLSWGVLVLLASWWWNRHRRRTT